MTACDHPLDGHTAHGPWCELRDDVPGGEGSIGPSPSQYGHPHVYARDIHCVCGRALAASLDVQAAPGVPIPDRMRP